MKKIHLSLCLVLCLMMLTGCGAGTTNPTPLPVNKAIELSADLKLGIQQTSLPISSIQVTFVLPKTATPILEANGSLQLGEIGLKVLNSNGSVPAGSYDPVTGTVQFILWLPKNVAIGLGTGKIARLTYETSSGIDLSSQDIQPVFKVVGTDLNLTDISSEIVPSVSIVTYQKP